MLQLGAINLQCLECKIDVVRKHRQKIVYCSQGCSAKHKERVNLQAILNATDATGFGVRSIKKALVIKNGKHCVICELTMWTGQEIPLVLDHIDGNPENWLMVNLRLICCNCDALTLTYKGRNRGKGRFNRRQRYREGKSF